MKVHKHKWETLWGLYGPFGMFQHCKCGASKETNWSPSGLNKGDVRVKIVNKNNKIVYLERA